jgi:hypothetical protein
MFLTWGKSVHYRTAMSTPSQERPQFIHYLSYNVIHRCFYQESDEHSSIARAPDIFSKQPALCMMIE